MASSLLRKLLNKPGLRPPPPLRALVPFDKPPLKSDPHPSPLASQSPIVRTPFLPFLPNANVGGTAGGVEGLACSLHPLHQVYPSFPHCFALDPVVADAASFPESDAESCGERHSDDDPAAVWADSVKKKRKRKMNKHKLRKLRKRLRRQT